MLTLRLKSLLHSTGGPNPVTLTIITYHPSSECGKRKYPIYMPSTPFLELYRHAVRRYLDLVGPNVSCWTHAG